MSNHLTELSKDDLRSLKNLYSPDGSKSYIAYTAIDNYIRWFEQDPNIKHIKIYCLNGDFSDGTFVITDRWGAYADTLNENYENLLSLLKLLDYSKGYVFLSVRTPLRPVIREAILSHGEIQADETTLLYYLPKEEALKFDIQPPDDITLHPVMEISDLEKVSSLWPFENPTKLELVKRMAKYNPNIGAYQKDGTLVSWLFRLPSGLLGALQSDSNFYGKGYANLVIRNVSRQIAEMGQDIHAGVFELNTPSRNLFTKLGFKVIGEVHWIASKIYWTSDDD